jgi:arginyl-tRNA synthetase
MLGLTGMSGPYLQYTYARLAGIGRKAGKIGPFDLRLLEEEQELAMIRHMLEFPHVLSEAARANLTNDIALYLYELANLANRFYESTPIIKDEYALRRNARRKLIEAAMGILAQGLGILGIKTLTRI